MDRRSFVRKSISLGASVGVLAHFPNAQLFARPGRLSKLPIGFQSFIVRKEISKDPAGLMQKMAAFGYQQVEMCSPAGYAMADFAPLMNYSGADLRKLITENGLSCVSCHFTWNEMMTNLADRINFAHQLGLRYFVCSGGLVSNTLEELKKRCAQLNEVGKVLQQEGLVAGYHNHNAEFEKQFEGRPQYDFMLEALNPDWVKMQFQVAAIQVGYKASDYFQKFPGRFISAHLQDYAKDNLQQPVVLGQGIVDWPAFFEAAPTAGLTGIYVEMDAGDRVLQQSATYLKNLMV